MVIGRSPRLLAIVVLALGGCDPGRFKDVGQARDAAVEPSGEAGSDSGSGSDSGPARQADGGGRPPSVDGGSVAPLVDGGSSPPTGDGGPGTPAVDAGGSSLPDAGPAACTAPPPAGRPLAFSSNTPRVVARVRNPPGVDLQLAHAIRPVGEQLLWTVMTTNTKTPNGYGTLARSPAAGPWAAPPETWPQALELTVQAGADGAPIPLLPASFTVNVVNPVATIARGAEASLYLKRYFGFGGTEMYLGQLAAGAFTLASAPVRLFESIIEPPGRSPLFGTSAYERAGTVYALACRPELYMMPFRPCSLARTPIAGLATKSSYEAYQAGTWTRDLGAATDIFESGDDVMSLSFNAYLGKWLLITAARADDGRGNGSVYVRAASAPEGPWTEQTTIKLPNSPEGIPARSAIEQPDLAQKCGQRLILSYVEPSLEYTNSLGFPQVSHGRIALIAFDLQ